MSEAFRNVVLNTVIMELLITVEFTIVLCGLFHVSQEKRKYVIGISFFKMYILNILIVFLRNIFAEQIYTGIILFVLNAMGLLILIGSLKYLLRVTYPKILAGLLAADIVGGGIGVIVYMLVQRQFIPGFTAEMTQFSLKGACTATILILILIWMTQRFVYKKLWWYAKIRLPVPFIFVIIYVIDILAGAYTYINFSWQSSILIAILFLLIGIGILYIVYEVTRRKVEREIFREYDALRVENESMKDYGNSILAQNQKREELQQKIRRQLESMEDYMKNNPEHHVIEEYINELKKCIKDET